MKQQHAFTLVELSIVLVILGLLIGGVLTGQSLIRAAELRSVSTQQARFATAVLTFRDKYFAIPGDMTNAQSYWGIANATPASCVTANSGTTATCNGDGNGQIDVSAGANERFRFWQHLANAGLIEGSYTGTSPSGLATATSTNSPVGRLSASLWYANYLGPSAGSSYLFVGDYGNDFLFGGTAASAPPTASILKPEEAYNIDMKTDDGKPATGKIIARHELTWATQKCFTATASTQLNADYLLSDTGLNCTLYFVQQF